MMWLYIGLAFVAVLTLAILLVRYLRRTQHTRQVNKLIRDLSRSELHQVLVPDAVDGEVWLDYLLLTDGGLLVLDIRDYTGNLFGGESINEWTQLIGVKSYKFNNPLLELPARIQAVQALVGDIPVTGQVVFTHRGQFQKGVPEGVCMVDEVHERLSGFLRPALPDEKLNEAWSTVRAAIQL
ncbi:MAG: NERD domain-containing protein [Gammaproteobacteria bacterium]|nr:NERD domain-containing protein [Gammaproteobacteria bacterium]